MLGYPKKGHLAGIPGSHDATMMYTDSLLWLVTVAAMFPVWLVLTLISVFDDSKSVEDSASSGIFFSISMVLALIGQWLSWAGFIGLAGDR